MKAGSLGTAVTVGILLWIGAHAFAGVYGIKILWNTSAAAGAGDVLIDVLAASLLIVPLGLLPRRRLVLVTALVAAGIVVAHLGTSKASPPGIDAVWTAVGFAPWLVAIVVSLAERYWQRDPEWDPETSQDAHPGFKGESYSQVKK